MVEFCFKNVRMIGFGLKRLFGSAVFNFYPALNSFYFHTLFFAPTEIFDDFDRDGDGDASLSRPS